MPPKFRFTREEITEVALELVREKGMDCLTARELALRLKSTPKLIFGRFENMAEVKKSVIESAHLLEKEYFNAEIASGKFPPYKAIGVGYIRFAQKERELFKLLYMRDRTQTDLSSAEEYDGLDEIIEIIIKNTGLSEEKALRLHSEMWVFVHGLAVMSATDYLRWNDEYIATALTDVYEGVKNRLISLSGE